MLITLVLVKAAFGRVFCHQLFQLGALKMQISIATKTTLPANKVYMTETQQWFCSVPIQQLRVAGVGFLQKRSQCCCSF